MGRSPSDLFTAFPVHVSPVKHMDRLHGHITCRGVSCRFARCLLLPRAVLELPAGTSYFLLICSTTSTGSNVIAGLIRRGQSSRPPVRWHRQRDPRPRRLRFRCVAGPVHMGSNACVRGANATTGLLYLTGALEERIMRGTWYSTFVWKQ
jgi:hypothetical protein